MAETTAIPSTKDGAWWRKQIDLALVVRRSHEPWWEANLHAYAPAVTETPESYGETIHTNRTFTLTERKKADLFYQRPDVTLTPSPGGEAPILGPDGQPLLVPGPPGPDGLPTQQPVPASVALSAHQAIVNEKLGEDGVDVTDLMDAVVFDVVCTQGWGCTELGYEAFMVDVPAPPDPVTGQVPVGPDGQPALVPVPMASSCFWEHFSGKQMLIPHTFRSTKWDTAPWLGRQFELPLTAANRTKYRLPPDFEGSPSAGRTQHYDHGTDQTASDGVFTGVVIWYRSILFREDRPHPDHYTQLILVDGIEAPVIEQDSPYQDLTPEGQLSPTSLLGNPIHPFSVRKLTDSAYPSSDGTMLRPLENELNICRTQNIQHRDAMGLRLIANGDVLPAEALGKIARSPIGGIIVVPAEAFVGEGAFRPLEAGTMPREHLQIADYIDHDMDRTGAVDASGSGVQGVKSQTATAEQIQAANANARIDKERAILLKRYVQGVTKFSTLIQRYFPVEEAVQIVGPEAAAAWDAWRGQVSAVLAFSALPDSALRVDQAVDRHASQELYSFLAQDPYVDRKALLTKLLRKFHLDPALIVKDPDPPKPEPPKLSLSITGQDFVGPQAPVIFEIAAQLGLQISEEAKAQTKALGALVAAMNAEAETAKAQAGDTTHGGKVAPVENLSKHSSDQTGAVQGIGGSPGAMGAPGGFLQ